METKVFNDIEPIFIVGASRSGTTLFQLMLNAHPDLAIYGEVHFFDTLSSLQEKLPDLSNSESIEYLFQLVESIHNTQYLPDTAVIFPKVEQQLKAENSPSYESFYRHLLEAYAESQDAARPGEKTPEYVRYLDDILQIFPKAKVIHMIRDPRAVVASLVKVPWSANDVIINTLKWKIDVLYGLQFRHRQRNYLEVFYKQLVADPEQELQRVMDFIGEDYSDNMLAFHRTSQSHVKNEPWKANTSKSINTHSLEKWRQELSAAQTILVEMLVGKSLLNQLGYEPSEKNFLAILKLPLTLLWEILKYCQYKYDEVRHRKDNPDVIHGSNERFYRMLLKALTQY